MYDNICKFLVEQYSQDFASWFLGRSVPLTELSPQELSLEPIRADSLILKASNKLILHLEFQTKPDPDIPFRMADYRLRVYRRFPDFQMRQAVVYLKQTDSPLVNEKSFTLSKTRHEFEVIRLWEQPPKAFLNSPGLLPFVVLSQCNNPTQQLRKVAQMLDTIPNRKVQANVSAASAILAGLVLDRKLITTILRRDIMQESVIYQQWRKEIYQEAEEKLAEKFRREAEEKLKIGRFEAMQQVARNLLASGMPLEQIAAVTGLELEQIKRLSDGTTED